MLIRDWMTTDVITVSPDTTMMKAGKLLKEHNIGRLPVVDGKGKLVGIVSDRDVKEASPSKATTLDVHELYYLISEIKVKDLMTRTPYSISPTDTVERAAQIMIEKDFSGLPVVDDDNKVIGIIADSDLFKILVDITGVNHGGVQFAVELANEPGQLKNALDDLNAQGARITSVMTSLDDPEDKVRKVYIRIMPMERFMENKIIDHVKENYKLFYWARDNVHPIIR